MEIDDSSPNKFFLIWFFYNGLRFLIKVQIKNSRKELRNWENLLAKTIKTKVKAHFLTPFIFQEIDQPVAQGKSPIKNTKTFLLEALIRHSKTKELKVQAKMADIQLSKAVYKAHKKKKKDHRNCNCKQDQWPQKNSTLATKINVLEP